MSDKKHSKSEDDDKKSIFGGFMDKLTGHKDEKAEKAETKPASKHKSESASHKSKSHETKSHESESTKTEAKPKTQEARNEMGSVLPMTDSEKNSLEKKHAKEAKEVQKRKEAADEEKSTKQHEATEKTKKLVQQKEKIEEKIADEVDPYYVEHPGFLSGNPATAVPPESTPNPHLQTKDNPGAPQVPFDPSMGTGGLLQVGDELPGSNPGKHKPPKPGTTLGGI